MKFYRYFWEIKKGFLKIKVYLENLEKKKKEINDKDNIKNKREAIIKLTAKKETRYNFWLFFKFWIAGLLVTYIAYLLFQTLQVLYLIMTAFIISIAIESIIQIFERFLPRWISIFISYILLFGFLVTGFVIVVPFIINQSAVLIKVFVDKIKDIQVVLQDKWLVYIIQQSSWIPQYFKNLFIELSKNNDFLVWIQSLLQKNISELAKLGTTYVRNVGEIAVDIVGKFLSAISQVIFVFVIAFFISLEKKKVINFIANLSGNREYVKYKFETLYYRLWNRLKWQLVMCLFIGLAVYFWLLILSLFWLDLPNKWILALIAWITEFIPILWPVLWAIPMSLIALTKYWFVGILVIAGFYAILQFFESNILIPLVMRQALGVSSLVILLTMTLWGNIFGFVGMVLWVPLAVIISLIFEDFIDED